MPAALSLSLLRWSAWTDGAATADQWQAWLDNPPPAAAEVAPPRVDFVPPMLRRRLSSLNRAALWVAVDCLGEQPHRCRTLFASPHGESNRTIELLQQLAASEPLSPNAFSLSVHNASAGLYALATGNRAASISLAAGNDTLPMAFVEAAGQLRRDPEPLLLVFANESLPAFYRPWQPQPPRPFALALLLAPPGGDRRQLSLQQHSADTADDVTAESVTLVSLLLHSATTTLSGERSHWCWSAT